EPSRVIRSVKRVLGMSSNDELVRHYASTAPFRVDTSGERPIFKLRTGDVAPEQIVACILRRVRELAEARFGARIEKVVLTVSAAAPPGYRDAVIRAARIAQPQVVALVG